MQITRHNYETFFLLYVDNELTPGDRLLVEAFVSANPDLQQELMLLQDTVLKPDNRFVFKYPEILHQSIKGISIDAANREEYFLLYADGELDNTNIQLVEEFVAAHPVYQPELQQILDAKLVPDLSEVFRDKQSLHRSEEKSRPVILRWATISAAACLLLLAGATWWYQNNKQTATRVVLTNPANGPVQPANLPSPAVLPAMGSRKIQPLPAVSSEPEIVVNKSRKSTPKNVAPSGISKSIAAEDAPVLAQQKRMTEPPKPAPLTGKTTSPELAGDSREIVSNKPLATEPVVIVKGKTTVVDEPVVYEDPYKDDTDKDVILTGNTDNNKNVFRGIIRKTARFIDRNTSLKATKKSGIHIGNIEIAFQ